MASSSKPFFTTTHTKLNLGYFALDKYVFSENGSLAAIDSSDMHQLRIYSPETFHNQSSAQEEKTERTTYNAIQLQNPCYKLYPLSSNRVFCRSYYGYHQIVNIENPTQIQLVQAIHCLNYNTCRIWKDKIVHVYPYKNSLEIYNIQFLEKAKEAKENLIVKPNLLVCCDIPLHYGTAVAITPLPDNQLIVGYNTGTIVILEFKEKENILAIKKTIISKTTTTPDNFLLVTMFDNLVAIIATQQNTDEVDIKFLFLQHGEWSCKKHFIGSIPGISDLWCSYDDTFVTCKSLTREAMLFDLQALYDEIAVNAIVSFEDDICNVLLKNSELMIKSTKHLRALELHPSIKQAKTQYMSEVKRLVAEKIVDNTAGIVMNYLKPYVSIYAGTLFSPNPDLKLVLQKPENRQEYTAAQIEEPEPDPQQDRGCCTIM